MTTALTPKRGSLVVAFPLRGSYGKNGMLGDLTRVTAPTDRAAPMMVFAVTPRYPDRM
jgi:hypothetical protein